MAVKWSTRVRADLAAIFLYIARDDPDAAERWIARLVARAESVATMPKAGRAVRASMRRWARRTMRILILATAIGALVAGCYSGTRTTRDINTAWQGRSRSQIEAHWGQPASATARGNDTVLVWTYTRHSFDLPSFEAELSVEPGSLDAYAAITPGQVRRRSTHVVAVVDASGRIIGVRGPSLRWGPPNDANIHYGVLFGMHAGMGRLDDTATALPSGGVYIGGMLSRTVGLVGTFSLVSGTDDDGGALGFVWGIAAQHWLETRLWVRAGPAAILAFEPGFDDLGFAPGITTGAGYALIKSGNFALDVRLDVSAGPSVVLGSAGIGINLN